MPDTPPSLQRTSPTEKIGRSRARRGNLLLWLASISTLLICIETGLRLTDLAPISTLAYPDEQTWASSPGPFAPNQDFVDRLRPDLPHRIRINSLGFRGHAFAFEKPAGHRRILCLGDTYTFGAYVNDDETFPAALERKLRQIDSGWPTEVINAGVTGYTIADEAALAEENGFALSPDIVIVGFAMNDLPDLARKISARDSQRLAAARISHSPLTPVRTLLMHTATYNFLFALKASLLGRLHLDPAMHEAQTRRFLSPPFDERSEILFEAYRSALLNLNDAALKRGCRLLLVLFPLYEQAVSGTPAEAQARLMRMAEAAGIPAVDLLPAFRAAGARAAKMFLVPLDHHPSAAGHRLAAREVSRFVVAEMAGAARPAGVQAPR